jgi:hypothetical protein
MTVSGYNCIRCGAWVYESQTHSCSVVGRAEAAAPVVWTREDVNTIIRLLTSIEYHVRSRGLRR